MVNFYFLPSERESGEKMGGFSSFRMSEKANRYHVSTNSLLLFFYRIRRETLQCVFIGGQTLSDSTGTS